MVCDKYEGNATCYLNDWRKRDELCRDCATSERFSYAHHIHGRCYCCSCSDEEGDLPTTEADEEVVLPTTETNAVIVENNKNLIKEEEKGTKARKCGRKF